MSSVTRAISTMELLARQGPLGVRAIATELDLPLGSAHRLLSDLAAEQVVERDDDGAWRLSYRLFAITGHQLDRLELPQLARPFAERIAAETGETVNVYALSGLESVSIDKVRGNEGMQLDLRLGASGPLHAGGSGKAMLAYLSERERDAVLDGPLHRYTEHTLVERAELEREIERIRGRGYAIDDQEVVMGVYCVSEPFIDRAGRPFGAMSITGPRPKAPGGDIEPLVAMLHEACSEVSRRLGYTGPWPPPGADG